MTGFSSVTAGLVLQATTGSGGFALQNATPNIISWTAPNDGRMHRAIVLMEIRVTSTQTGGGTAYGFTDPGGGTPFITLRGGNDIAGTFLANGDAAKPALMGSGATLTVQQSSAQTAGAAVVYAEIWGS